MSNTAAKPMYIYKIRDTLTGLFSSGGARPAFNKKGKMWNGAGPVSLHFATGVKYPKHVEVVQYAVVEVEGGATPASEWMAATEERAAARRAAADKWRENYQREERRKQFEKLQREFGSGQQS